MIPLTPFTFIGLKFIIITYSTLSQGKAPWEKRWRWISINNQAPIRPIWQLHGTAQYSNLTKVVSQLGSIFGLPGRSRGKYSCNVESVIISSKLTLRLGHVVTLSRIEVVVDDFKSVFLIQVSDHDTENLHFPGVGKEAARCGIFYLLIRMSICKTIRCDIFLTKLQM